MSHSCRQETAFSRKYPENPEREARREADEMFTKQLGVSYALRQYNDHQPGVHLYL